MCWNHRPKWRQRRPPAPRRSGFESWLWKITSLASLSLSGQQGLSTKSACWNSPYVVGSLEDLHTRPLRNSKWPVVTSGPFPWNEHQLPGSPTLRTQHFLCWGYPTWSRKPKISADFQGENIITWGFLNEIVVNHVSLSLCIWKNTVVLFFKADHWF